MNLIRIVLAVAISTFQLSTVIAKQGDGTDLPVGDPLRIGIKKRSDNCSKKSKTGDTLSVHYVGKLYSNNKQFDSSRDRQQPFKFVLGRRNVIRGWDQGMIGMCVGEVRKLTIPAGLGYGDAGAGNDIHGGATLVFDVELLDIISDSTEPGPWSDHMEDVADDDDAPEM